MIFGHDDVQTALQVAAESDSVHGWMWAAKHPDTSEKILIILAAKKSNTKIRVMALLHPNATDEVAKAVKDSRSIEICKAILQSSNISDDIKEAWIDTPSMIKGLTSNGLPPWRQRSWFHDKAWAELSDYLKDKLATRLEEREERKQRQRDAWVSWNSVWA